MQLIGGLGHDVLQRGGGEWIGQLLGWQAEGSVASAEEAANRGKIREKNKLIN